MSDTANNLRSFRAGETLDDIAKLAATAPSTGAQGVGTPTPLPENDPYAPASVRNKIAADRVPGLTRDAVLKMFEDAAQGVERAAEALQQMTIERVAEAKETATTLRELGALQAASIERAANFAYDQANMFHAEAQRVAAFRDAITPGAKVAA